MDETMIPETVWIEYVTDANRSYFYNKETKETTWKVPGDYLAWKDSAVKAYLKTTNWKKAVDKKEKEYYYDKVTKQTQWNAPSDVVDFEMRLLKINLSRYESRKRKAKEITTDSTGKSLLAVAQNITGNEVATEKDGDVKNVSKIRKRVAESEENEELDQYDSDATKTTAKAVVSTAAVEREKATSDYFGSTADGSDREEDYSQDADDFPGHGDEVPVTGGQGTDLGSGNYDLDSFDQGSGRGKERHNEEYQSQVYSTDQQESGFTPEQRTPEYQETTPQGTPQYQETTPQGTPQYQETTPQGTPQYQETTPQGTPQYQETTPQGTPQYQETTPDGYDANTDTYGTYGEYDKNEGEEAEGAAAGSTGWTQDYESGPEGRYEGGDDSQNADSQSQQSEAFLQEEMKILKALDEKLCERDSIMELSVAESIRKSIELRDGCNPEVIIRKIADSYAGYAQMSHIASEWLSMASMLNSTDVPAAGQSTGAAEARGFLDPEAAVVEHLAAMVKQKFDSTVADAIIPKLRDTPEWLKKMMGDQVFRKMLIELHDQNRNSTLIKIALKEICKMGHHQEIAHVIRDLDYFDVFNDSDLLVDILVRANQADEAELENLLEVLTRMCGNTEYMFLYTIDLLAVVDKKLKLEIEIDSYRRVLSCSTTGPSNSSSNGCSSSSSSGNGSSGLNGGGSNSSRVSILTAHDDGDGGDDGRDNSSSNSDRGFSNSASSSSNSRHGPDLIHVSNGSENGTGTGVRADSEPGPSSIPPAVRQRRRLRRFRQELEKAAVWGKRDVSTGALTNQGAFAVRLLGSHMTDKNSSSSSGANGSSSSSSRNDEKNTPAGWEGGRRGVGVGLLPPILAITAEILKYNQVTAAHLWKLCVCYFGPAAQDDPDNFDINTPALAPCHPLRDSLILDLLISTLLHPSKQLPAPAQGRVAKLLAFACGSAYEENPATEEKDKPSGYEDQSTDLSVLENALLTTREICNEMAKTAVGLSSYDRPLQLLSLLSQPLVSVCVLRWIGALLRDADFTRKAAFLSVLPVFLQLIVQAGAAHPFQRQDCFDLYKMILMLSPSDQEEAESSKRFQASAEAYTIVTGQKDAMDCLVHLMGSGFVAQPMAFLATHLAGLDAVLVRHLVRTLLHAVEPPFTPDFAFKMIELLSSGSSRKAITSSYFPRADAMLLRGFHRHIASSRNTHTLPPPNSTANSNPATKNGSEIDGVKVTWANMDSAVLAQFADVVLTCCTIHKL